MSKLIIIGLFLAAAAGLGLLALLARREDSKIPSLGAVAGFVMSYQVGRVPVGRVAILGFWWWVGWHFFAR